MKPAKPLQLPPIKPKIRKVAVNVMLPVATKEKLDRVAKTHGITRGDYIERALEVAFANDGVE